MSERARKRKRRYVRPMLRAQHRLQQVTEGASVTVTGGRRLPE